MAPIPPPAASGTTSTTEHPLYWARYGPAGAPMLLVLHGGPGAHHDYLLPQMLELANLAGGHELLFYDQRGGGRSRDAQHPITWESQTRDVGLVAREFGLPAPIIVGYSWGGLLAMLYAASAREAGMPAPAALVLVDPAPISRTFRQQFESEFSRRLHGVGVQRLRSDLATSGLRDRDPDAYRQRNFELSVAGYFADPLCAHDLTPFRVNARVQHAVWDSLGDFDLARDGTLSAIEAPTLILHGRQDPIPLASSEEAAGAIGGGGARLVVIENCGHVPYVEQPEVLFRAIDDFLRSIPPAAPARTPRPA